MTNTLIEEIVHELIDVAAGVQAHLPRARALEMHDQITPGYNDEPVSEEEAKAAQAVLDRQQRERDKAGQDKADRDKAAAERDQQPAQPAQPAPAGPDYPPPGTAAPAYAQVPDPGYQGQR